MLKNQPSKYIGSGIAACKQKVRQVTHRQVTTIPAASQFLHPPSVPSSGGSFSTEVHIWGGGGERWQFRGKNGGEGKSHFAIDYRTFVGNKTEMDFCRNLTFEKMSSLPPPPQFPWCGFLFSNETFGCWRCIGIPLLFWFWQMSKMNSHHLSAVKNQALFIFLYKMINCMSAFKYSPN